MRRTVAAAAVLACAAAFLSAPAEATVVTGTKVMPLGDSITYGFRTGPGCTLQEGGYRTGLWTRLVDDGITIDFVGSLNHGPTALGDKDHEGHCGKEIQFLIDNVDTYLAAANPQVVLLHIGTNDMNLNHATGAVDRLSALVDQIAADVPGVTIYLAAIIPANNATVNARITAYDQAIPALVRSKVSAGLNVVYVNQHDALRLTDLADTLHPNSTGYDKMAATWYAALQGTPPNLILSSGFEDTFANPITAPWYTETTGTGSFGVDRGLGFAHGGADNGWIATSGTSWNALKQNVSVTPNTNYRLAAWIQNSGNFTGGYFGVKTTTGTVIEETHHGAAATYTHFTIDFNSGNRTTIAIHAGYWGPGVASWERVDDWSLSAIP
jgi:lysophospholipase L1-like esterase